MSPHTDFGATLESQTETYLGKLTECTDLLPTVLTAYADGEEYAATTTQIEEIESECDQLRREITASIANADSKEIGLLNTPINLNQSALLDFYKQLDVVANHTERIAQELGMVQPEPANDSYDQLQEMAALIVEMTDVLSDVVARFITGLARNKSTETLVAEIEQIRTLESRCDIARNEVIATAFESDLAQPLVYRELAVLFDELANTIEDLTDRITVISSDEPGIVTEGDPDSSA